MATIPALDLRALTDLHALYWELDLAEASDAPAEVYWETVDQAARGYLRERMGLPVREEGASWSASPLPWPEEVSVEVREAWRLALDDAYFAPEAPASR